jgi:hypothetical protein
MSNSYPYKAKERVEALLRVLHPAVERDPDQEVRGGAIAALDAALSEVKRALPNDPVVQAVAEVISPETIDAGEPVRAFDALLVAEQLSAAIGRRPQGGRTASW